MIFLHSNSKHFELLYSKQVLAFNSDEETNMDITAVKYAINFLYTIILPLNLVYYPEVIVNYKMPYICFLVKVLKRDNKQTTLPILPSTTY